MLSSFCISKLRQDEEAPTMDKLRELLSAADLSREAKATLGYPSDRCPHMYQLYRAK